MKKNLQLITTGMRMFWPLRGGWLAAENSDEGEGENKGGDDPSSGPNSGPKPTAKPTGKPNGPRNPWQPPVTGGKAGNRPPSLEELFRPRPGAPQGPTRGTGSGQQNGGFGGLPPRGPALFQIPRRPDGKSWTPLVLGGLAVLWLLGSSSHQLATNEEGLVTTFGKYTATIGPGFNLTAPWPLQRVYRREVTSIQVINLPEAEGENLMLTGDQSLVNLSYMVRWNIKDLKKFAYQLKDPEGTVAEVAEAAMRASVAEVSLSEVMGGSGRAEIESHVRARMQAVLDAYRAGVRVTGVAINKADPPNKVIGAFQAVQAAQQDYNRDVSRANGEARKVIDRATADAAQFDAIYAQYKLAPEVTRRRLYYETMESVMANNDKVIAPAAGMTSYLPLPAINKRPPAIEVVGGPSGAGAGKGGAQ